MIGIQITIEVTCLGAMKNDDRNNCEHNKPNNAHGDGTGAFGSRMRSRPGLQLNWLSCGRVVADRRSRTVDARCAALAVIDISGR